MSDTGEVQPTGFEVFITCPYCGASDEEMTEYPRSLQRDGDTAEYECDHCERTFRVVLCVEYTYQGEPLATLTPAGAP